MADVHTWNGTPTEAEKALMEDRMRLFIFPNVPYTEEETAAFDKAVAYQIAHEKSREEKNGNIPEGVEAFKIGDFSMNFSDGVNASGLNRQTICQAAYSVLLRAGLLYRGLDGRCCGC